MVTFVFYRKVEGLTDLENYGQNVAAITAIFYEDSAASQHILQVLENTVTGDVELWEILAKAGLVFTQEEATYTPGVDFNWYDAVEDFTTEVMGKLANGGVPLKGDLQQLAWEAIGDNSLPSELCRMTVEAKI